MVRLRKVAICTVIYPRLGKWDRGVVIRKRGKDNCMKLKAHCPTSLLSSVSKDVENSVPEMPSEDAARRGLQRYR